MLPQEPDYELTVASIVSLMCSLANETILIAAVHELATGRKLILKTVLSLDIVAFMQINSKELQVRIVSSQNTLETAEYALRAIR